ncbi:ComF family protein [Lactobacillus sp. LC28-10]|uniref:ComF family protein n=1 Tax=Secundilactobacillus angelensis TaxID=2722706 RepID=A0ABX1KZT3_9LACO|nr:ComF family protein [Secundilactobacillus angelensis]MCH5462207.1 ComF family protein [Secundilactobacillus angelensis]NLR18498.1 ComF family protein [Secundilactobacillus angelensis]
MTDCLLCHRDNFQQPTLWQLFNFQPIEPTLLCQTCLNAIDAIPADQACSGCGRLCSKSVCDDCLRWQEPQDFKNRAMFQYNALLRQFMSQYKFYGDYQLRKVFQTKLKREVAQFKADFVVPIPINPATQQQRGFNQVAGLLEQVETVDGLKTLHRDKQQPQSAKNRQQRMQTQQPFTLNLDPEKFNKKRVLIVDDIYTTGRTIRHAAMLFQSAGATEVMGLTLAHG